MSSNPISYPQKDRWSFLWLLVGALFMFFWRIPLTWWLAPVFLLRFMRTHKVRVGFPLVWLVCFLSAIPPMYSILNALMPTPLPVFLAITALFALLTWALPYLADRLLAPHLPGFAATLVLPAAMTTMSYIGAKTNPLGSIGGAAYSQHSNLALLQVLSITGMWGIVFLVNWLGPVVNYAWEGGFDWITIRRNMLVYLVIMLGVLLFGGARLGYAPQASSTVRVHGITEVDMRSDMLPKMHAAQAQDWEIYRQLSLDVQELYLQATLREAQAGAQIVHWPEMAVAVPKEDETQFVAQAQQVAQDESIYLVMAYDANYRDGSPFENKLLVVDPAGKIVLEHYKYAALLDGSVIGDSVLHTVETPYGTLSGIICNDTDHEEVVTQAGKNGTDILFSPSMEYQAIDPIHAHMAIYRAIENGVTLVRQADNGLSIVVDPYGRVMAEMDHFNSSPRVMAANVPIQSAFALYPYIGDLFAWLAIACFALLTLAGIAHRRRTKHMAGKSSG